MCEIKEEREAQRSRVMREEQSCKAGEEGWGGSCLQERGTIWGWTHLEWRPALVRGGCGGGGPILCTPGRMGASQQWGGPAGTQGRCRPLKPCPCPGSGRGAISPPPPPPWPTQALPTHRTEPASGAAPRVPRGPVRPAFTWAELPGLFWKLLNETRLASGADVILRRRGQLSAILGSLPRGCASWTPLPKAAARSRGDQLQAHRETAQAQSRIWQRPRRAALGGAHAQTPSAIATTSVSQ